MAGQCYFRDEDQLYPIFKRVAAFFENEVSPSPDLLALVRSVTQFEFLGGKISLTCSI